MGIPIAQVDEDVVFALDDRLVGDAPPLIEAPFVSGPSATPS